MKRSDKQEPEYRVVYSTDKPTCPGCHREFAKCTCGKSLLKGSKPRIRIERKGRGGKCVTILSHLPAREELLRELCSALKRALGVGGTYYIDEGLGIIEVQGEHTEAVLKGFEKFRDS